jgi:mono/diheme cytochrome c family protein
MARSPAALALTAGAVVFAASIYLQAQADNPGPTARKPSLSGSPIGQSATQELLQRYCISCHNARLKTASLALDSVDLQNVAAQPQVWEKVVTKLRTAAMPPVGRPRPDAATYDAAAGWLEGELDRAAKSNPHPGVRPPLHRLNRSEYKNAARDLLALDDLPREMEIDVLLPADDASYGFDNIADALGTSPTLIERYLSAAQKISRLAIGDAATPLIVDTYKLPPQLPQEDRFDGLPYGTRGGIRIERFFPLDGEYTFRMILGGARSPDRHDLELLIDGERAQVFTIDGRGRGRGRAGGPSTAPAPGQAPASLTLGLIEQAPPDYQVKRFVPAGHHTVIATFVKKTSAAVEDVLRPFSRSGQAGAPAQPALASVTITGPLAAAGPGDTASRRRILTCHPNGANQESACAKEILSTLAKRAYRRPVGDEDLQTLLTFYEAGRAEGSFEAGIQRALERMLVSPYFLFRAERDPAAPAGRISDLELASRLSFFLWSSIPDDALIDVAARNSLHDPVELERQVKRMLADPRASALVDNFASQWLFLRNVDAASPDPRVFPDFDEALRRAMRRETELFVHDVLANDRSVRELLTADYTFLNERLARHYGVAGVYGDQFRRVSIADTPRRGLLGHASLLTVTSYAHRTSPVLRGKWMLDNLLGAPPPPPPPDIPALQETNNKTGKALTMREAMEQHRANPSCAGCHARMDPLGFALENYDAVGRWRTQAANTPIDASGTLPDGTRFDGARGLIDAILRRPDAFATTVTERLMTYAIGRGIEYFDAPAVRAIRRDAAAQDYRFSAIVLGIVNSVPFQMRATAGGRASSASAALRRTVHMPGVEAGPKRPGLRGGSERPGLQGRSERPGLQSDRGEH